jgi:uncharacterized cupredoxin-like copper-binding protein
MRTRSVLVGLLALGVLGACGGGSEPSTMTVVGTEMAFAAPTRVAAGEYEVTYRNDGTTYHELAFTDPNGTVVTRRSIAAGQQVVMDVDLKPGTWELGCYEPGHYEAGMHQTLEVTAGVG